MGNLHLVTGYAGSPHVTAEDHASMFEAAIRSGEYVMNAGTCFAATVIDNNTIQIGDGELMMQGRHVKLDLGKTVNVTIESGVLGQERIDYIVARYIRNTNDGIEGCSLVVLKGTPAASDPAAPECITGDINGEKALGEALDIRQGTPFCNPCTVYAGSYPDAAGSDIVVITSGVARKPGQTRLDLAQTNVNILKSITPEITKYAPDATYVIVSNPVDVLTYVFTKISGIPEERVIGSGTILDTARLRSRLSEYYKVSQHNVHAYVLGEHGESQFVPWSIANISNVPVEEFGRCCKQEGKHTPVFITSEVEEYVRRSGAEIIARKGATFYAIALSVTHICKCVLMGLNTSLTVSAPMHGEYGVDDVCLSTLSIVGEGGLGGKLICQLTDEENRKLIHCGEVLRETIKLVL